VTAQKLVSQDERLGTLRQLPCHGSLHVAIGLRVVLSLAREAESDEHAQAVRVDPEHRVPAKTHHQNICAGLADARESPEDALRLRHRPLRDASEVVSDVVGDSRCADELVHAPPREHPAFAQGDEQSARRAPKICAGLVPTLRFSAAKTNARRSSSTRYAAFSQTIASNGSR
jgi:hypothetical protein